MGGSGFAASSNTFGFELYRLIARRSGNVVFSPASISTALAMTWAGARGETAAQMAAILRLGGAPDAVATAAGRLAEAAVNDAAPSLLRIASRLFGDRRFRFEDAYLKLSAAAFGAALEPVDFADASGTCRRINAWVEDQTANRISNLVPEIAIHADTRLVLVNAVYLLGKWLEPFHPGRTLEEKFSTSAREQKTVPTMHRTAHIAFARGDEFTAIELPYKGGQLSMIVVLPERLDGVGGLERSFTADTIDELIGSLRHEQVAISLPRFEISPDGMSLATLLRELGMALPFDSERADFTGIADPPDPADRLYIGDVIHKAFVRTDEEGTEAAAATAVLMLRAGSLPRRPIPFTADHPFLFFVVHRPSRLVLFMGRVADPTEN